ncbi:MAG TPA: TonB-dependent receptor [Saprospiraceae bacterium]|nr:TonB-dependent receptor [Saprospiraceae bacterium]
MRCARLLILLCILYSPHVIFGQDTSFDSFISRLAHQYNVDVAVAPELIPVLDSLEQNNAGSETLEQLLQEMFRHTYITYEIVDGNKVLLRREQDVYSNEGQPIVQGFVKDKFQKPLSFAGVSVPNSTRGTYTNEAGYFQFAVDQSTKNLQINYLGYKSQLIPIEKFVGAQHLVEMEAENVPLDLVTIIVPYYQLSAQSDAIELRGYQFFSEDELLQRSTDRLIDQLAGYTHFSSEKGIRLRGSEEENTLFVMDGIPVYDPYHFYNLFSPFNGHYFPSIHVYKNNVPVEYGGKIDGMIDLHSATTNGKSKLIFDTDLLLTSLAAEAVLSENISIRAAGRFSHTGLINESLSDSATSNFTVPGRFTDENEWNTAQQPEFNFYDVNFGLDGKAGKKNMYSFAYFRSSDHLDNLLRTDLSTTVQNHEIISIEQEMKSNDDWKNEGVAMQWKTQLNNNTNIHLQGSYSYFKKESSYFAELDERFPKTSRHSINEGFQENNLASTNIKAFLQHDEADNDEYTIGLDFQHHDLDLIAKENSTPYLLEVQQENEITGFGEYVKNFDDNLEVSFGARLTYLQSTSTLYPQPQLRLQHTFNDNWFLKSSFSKNIQAVRELTIENRFGREVDFLALSQPDAGYPILRSDKYMLGGGFTEKKLSLDGEFFYKKVDGLVSVRAPRPDPSFQDVTSPGDFYRLFVGDGSTIGFEFLSSYKLKDFETTLSYTLSKISQEFDKLFNGQSFSPKEDRRHQLKLSSQYKFGQFIASGLINYKSEAPYVSFRRIEGQGGIGMADYEMSVKYIPSYFSLDLGLDYTFSIAKQTAQIGASVINATDHTNINDLQHVGRIMPTPGMGDLFLIHETELLGRTFNLHFRVLIN